MKTPALSVMLVAIGVASSCVIAGDRMFTGFPDLPKDAQEVAERSLACMHFGGEVNGTGDERDQDVARQLKKLNCDRVERELKDIRFKYRKSPKVLKILEEAGQSSAA